LKNINQTPENYMGMNIYSLLNFFEKKFGKKLKIRNKRNRKKILLAFKKQKKWKKRQKKLKNLFIIKETKKGKQSNEKETKIRILLLELTITRNKMFKKKQKKGKKTNLFLNFKSRKN